MTSTRHIQFLSNNRPGRRMGMGHYERLLITHLAKHAPAAEWQFGITFDGRSPEEALDPAQLDGDLKSADFLGFATGRLAKLPWGATRALVNRRFRATPPDLYHSLALSYPPPSFRPSVFTIHDLPPARFSDEGTVPRWAEKAAQAASAILTPSEFAKRELVELLELPESKVHVIYYGCEHDRFHPGIAPASPEVLASHGISGKFLLYVGGFTQRKNVRNLLAAWRLIESKYSDLSLVLVGPTAQLQAIAQEAGVPRVVVGGYMDHTQLPAVMKASQALVFPSIYEGFGLPPQEAMALGVPVVAVRSGGAIPEVVGDAGVLAEDGSPESVAAAMRQLLNDEPLAQKLRRDGPQRVQRFSWQKHAEEVLAVYRRVIDERK